MAKTSIPASTPSRVPNDPCNTMINKEDAILKHAAETESDRTEIPAPWMDITLGNRGWCGACCLFPFMGFLGTVEPEQHGQGRELRFETDDDTARFNGQDAVLDHINFQWFMTWLFYLMLVEISYESLGYVHNPFTSSGAGVGMRMGVGAVCFYLIGVSALFFFMYALIVMPLGTGRHGDDLWQGSQHAGGFRNLSAEWFTNYLTIIFPVILHVCIISWTVIPILGCAQYDDINYANTIKDRSDLAASALTVETIFSFIGIVVMCMWNLTIYLFKSAKDRKDLAYWSSDRVQYTTSDNAIKMEKRAMELKEVEKASPTGQ
jgi:hypothetical protein